MPRVRGGCERYRHGPAVLPCSASPGMLLGDALGPPSPSLGYRMGFALQGVLLLQRQQLRLPRGLLFTLGLLLFLIPDMSVIAYGCSFGRVQLSLGVGLPCPLVGQAVIK